MAEVYLGILAVCAIIRTALDVGREVIDLRGEPEENGVCSVGTPYRNRQSRRFGFKSPIDRAEKWLEGRR